jgi:rubrerythrin
METVRAGDVFKVAIEIEKNGEKFYRYAAGLAEDPKTKEVFTYTAGEEAKHRKTFEAMAEQVDDDYTPPETYPGEYRKYVKAYSQGIVFPEGGIETQFKKVVNVEDALEFAIQKEIESILYYLEMRNFVPDSQRKDVDKIVEEERRHYLNLTDLKRTVA